MERQIEQLVDLELYHRLTVLFDGNHQTISWLDLSRKAQSGKWNALGAREVPKLMTETAEPRELNALALFLWLYRFQNQDFLDRLIKSVEERSNVFFEAAIYSSSWSRGEADEVMHEILSKGKRETSLEYLLALEALRPEETESEVYVLSMAASGLLNCVSVEEDFAIFLRCAETTEQCGAYKVPICAGLYDLRRTVPTSNWEYWDMFHQWSFSSLDLLKLCVISQKGHSYDKGFVANRSSAKEKLEKLLAKGLAMLEREWTSFEKHCAEKLQGGFPVQFEGNVCCNFGLDPRSEFNFSELEKKLGKEKVQICVASFLEIASDQTLASVFGTHPEIVKECAWDDKMLAERLVGLEVDGVEDLKLALWKDSGSYVELGRLLKESDRSLKGLTPLFKFLDLEELDFLSEEEFEEVKETYRRWLEIWAPDSYADIFDEPAERTAVLYRWCNELPETEEDSEDDVFREALQQKYPNSDWSEVNYAYRLCWCLMELGVAELSQKQVDRIASAWPTLSGVKANLEEATQDESTDWKDKVSEEFPWVNDVDWVDGFELDLNTLRVASENQIEILKEFGGEVPLGWVGDVAKLKKLKEASGKNFEIAFELVQEGFESSSLLKVQNLPEALREANEYSVESSIGLGFCFYLRGTKVLKKFVEDFEGADWVKNYFVFNPAFYQNCNFTRVDLDELIAVASKLTNYSAKVYSGAKFGQWCIPEMFTYDPIEVAVAMEISDKKGFRQTLERISGKLDGLSVHNLNVLRYHLGLLSYSGWEKYFKSIGVAKEGDWLRMLGYPFEWNASTVKHLRFVIESQAIGKWETCITRVRSYSIHEFCKGIECKVSVERVAELWESGDLNSLEDMYHSTYREQILQRSFKDAVQSWLKNDGGLPAIALYPDADKSILDLCKKYRIGFIDGITLTTKYEKEKEKRALLFLNLIDGSWLNCEGSLYCVRRCEDGVGVLLCDGEDVVSSDVPRVVGEITRGVTTAPIQLNYVDGVFK